MAAPTAPKIDCDRHHPTLMVADVLASAEFYTKKLGFQLGFTWGDPTEMVGLNLGDVSIHLAQGAPCPQGCSVYFIVGDADELFGFHRANEVETIREPGDRPWGIRDFKVRDLDGYELAFGHYLPETQPPLKIERVDVPVRLEKRLAALLQDLADHKGMSVSSCLEETLLHTFEPVGGGVASPHTKRTLRLIEELKVRHGVDYGVHGSYRFVEG